MTRRQEQIADLIQREVAELLSREIKHPLLQDTLLSITQVEVTGDLSRARIHISVLDDRMVQDDPIDIGGILDALQRSSGFMHRTLIKRLHLRRVPRLEFQVDGSIVEANRLTTLMREVADAEGRVPFQQDNSATQPSRPTTRE